jgi:hypothetical protein
MRLQWFVRPLQLGTVSASIARLYGELHLPTVPSGTGLIKELAWLDTGAPLSVVPFDVHSKGLDWQPVPGVPMTWQGIPCDLGQINVWVTDLFSGTLQGPYAMLAKFPQRDPPGKPVPVLLGLEFLLTNRPALRIDPPPLQGQLRFP